MLGQRRGRLDTGGRNYLKERWRRGFPVGSRVKNPPATQEPQETRVWSLGWEDPLQEEMVTHSNILAWRILWTEEPGGLPSIGSHRVRHNWMTEHGLIGWRKEEKQEAFLTDPWFSETPPLWANLPVIHPSPLKKTDWLFLHCLNLLMNRAVISLISTKNFLTEAEDIKKRW